MWLIDWLILSFGCLLNVYTSIFNSHPIVTYSKQIIIFYLANFSIISGQVSKGSSDSMIIEYLHFLYSKLSTRQHTWICYLQSLKFQA